MNNKIALVTGSSRGIGRAIAIELAKEKYIVCINYTKDEQGINETKRLIDSIGGTSYIYKGDISNYDTCINIVNDINSNIGNIDILINNAGISKVGLFIDMPIYDIHSVIDVNIKGTINITHATLQKMMWSGSGCIVNISSIWGECGASCEVAYSATKGAINTFTKALAKEVGTSNIRVNAILPGVINTEMNSWLTNEEEEDLINDIPLCKFGDVSDVAALVSFLCSDKAKYITGQIIKVDGGMV